MSPNSHHGEERGTKLISHLHYHKTTKHLPYPYLLEVDLPFQILFLLLLRADHLGPLDLPETPDHLPETPGHLPETPGHLPETPDHQVAVDSPAFLISVGC